MTKQPIPFQIRFTKQVVFRDRDSNVLKVFEVGDVTEATYDTGHYYGTTWGGIYHEEAEIVQ